MARSKRSKAKAAPPVKKRGGGRRGNNADPKPNIRENAAQYAIAGIIAIIAVAVFYVASSNDGSSAIQNNKNKKEAFLKWFLDNGGTLHPIGWGNDSYVNVTIKEFPYYGGWGLALPIPPTARPTGGECRFETPDGKCVAEDEKMPIIKHLDPLFTVPSSIIISVESIVDTYASASSPLYLLNKILTEEFPNGPGLAIRGMGLVEQDVVIAMHLMVEDCHHRHARLFQNDEGSRWGPYLDILPQYTIPRLDTFGDEEYAVLQDEGLERVGRNSRKLLERMHSNNGSGASGPSLKTVAEAMIRQKNGPTLTPVTIPESCLSFETFHRFVGIVSSRAMVIKGVKHLTPLAEMINYSPKEENKDLIRAPFDLYHTPSGDKSITVRSDRDISLADKSAEDAEIQLFEDYGPVDSSLFLEAHGFVPDENPNNCATIPGSFFLRRNPASGRYDEKVSLVLQALKALHLIHPETKQFEKLEDVCVRDDMVIVDDGNSIGRKPASDSIAIISLVLNESDNSIWNVMENDHGETLVSLRDKCIAAIRSGDTERMEIRCARYPGSDRIVKLALRMAAGRLIRILEVNSEMKLLMQLQNAVSRGRDSLAVALRFRIGERKILNRIADSEDEVHHEENEDVVTNQFSSPDPENLEARLIAFNSFIESLKLPLNKIEPRLVGSGMRIGTFVKEDLDIDDAYLSLPANSVIDMTTALTGVDEASDFASLLRKYSNYQQNDGFDVLLIYLLHERFLLKEQSRWWPYLDLLPSIEEFATFHPLFFGEEEINRYLAGSDVRGFILRYQQRAVKRHAALSSDLDANLILGSDVLLDKEKVYWATAVLDSRSIWWNGKRHLTPLLDLVNADNEGRAHETRLEDSKDKNQQAAVTRASRRVRKGEQVFENYAQPNYLLFTYHGFLLEENNNDCALLDGLFIHHNDPGAKSAHRLRSPTPAFCIRDLASIEELAHFLRIKHGLSSVDSSGSNINDDVRPHLVEVLEERVARLKEVMATEIEVERHTLPRLHFMRQMVENDLMHFQHALNTHVLVQN